MSEEQPNRINLWLKYYLNKHLINCKEISRTETIPRLEVKVKTLDVS
jgi:hypothetical protein